MFFRLGRAVTALDSSTTRPSFLMLALCVCLALPASGSETEEANLQTLALERDLIVAELTQLEKTVALLQGSTRGDQGESSAAVKRLNGDILELKQQLLGVSQQEVALLSSNLAATEATIPVHQAEPREQAIESKPLPASPSYSAELEQAQVAKLHQLLRQYQADEEAAKQTQPTVDELAQRAAASRDADRLSRIPFNAGKVRLSGAEGSTALAQISERLSDPGIPESRRDTAPLASIKTYLFGSLIFSERRSLKPVGKHHYMTKVHLQPGDTTVRLQGYRWEISLPEDVHTTEYLVTLYKPPGHSPELHIFSVDELLGASDAHIPAWLPQEFGIRKSG